MAEAAPPAKKKKSNWAHVFTVGALAVGLGALAWTIYSVGIYELWHNLEKVGWWFFAIMGLEVIISSLDAAAMHRFMSPDHTMIPYSRTLLAQVSGRAVNVVVPSGNVGEVVKVSVLVEGGVPDSRAVAGIVVYNLAGLLAELAMVAVGAPIMAVAVPMGWGLRAVLFGAAGFSVVVGLALLVLVQKGMLVSFARMFRRMRLISQPRFERWSQKLGAIDAKIRIEPGPQLRDRWIGIGIVFLSRSMSWSLTAVLLHAVGQPITFGYYAAITVGGFAVYLIATLVPFGLGISEGGNAALFKALGIDPAIGVATALAKRVRDIAYATIGLVLLLASETVQEARARSKRRSMQMPAQPGPDGG
ncbi:MAG TPA: lysylphosphatidylglycerol synthase transmembrane domain-containing protein [Kofleriaceae bacterium]|jgi:hypothetical protein|nr:lysylphosphatidylglycerol synthase transmembrane domain-containing protein [Kofleriaceae bacterium]